MSPRITHDVMIIGGGPVGLSAALLLGRCLRSVVVCDAGRPRNERSPAMHGFLGADGISPAVFLRKSRAQLKRYDSVRIVPTTVADVTGSAGDFEIRGESGDGWRAKTVLLATGLIDKLPSIAGIERFYGVSVHHCPYCDGWENRGKMLGVIGSDKDAVDLAVELKIWSDHVTLFTNGGRVWDGLAELGETGIRLVPDILKSLTGRGKILRGIRLTTNDVVSCEALFFSPIQAQHSQIAQKLGCQIDQSGIECAPDGSTQIEGLFVAGNASKGVQMAIVAAAEGIKAAAAINNWLMKRGSG